MVKKIHKITKTPELASLKAYGLNEEERGQLAQILRSRDEKLSQLIRRLLKDTIKQHGEQ
jgi:hypothetical protein